MSVRFDQGSDQALEALYPPNAGGGPRLSGNKVTVTLWLYVQAASVPGTGQTGTIWWFGEADAGDNELRLVATEGTTTGFNLKASLVGQSTLGPVEKEDLAADEWHCVSVVVDEGQGQSDRVLTLFVDDTNAATASGPISGVSLSGWDTFSLARDRSGGATNLGAFLFEHAAIWNDTLGNLDNANMYQNRIPPDDGSRLTIGAKPDFSYWYCTAHSRSGIEVRNRDDGWQVNGGEFYNQSTPTGQDAYPELRIPQSYEPAEWNARTPVMRYDDVQGMTPIADRVIFAPSRLQPHFWFFSEPDVGGETTDEQVTALAIYHDSNLSKFGQADCRSGNQLEPPLPPDDVAEYFPIRDLAQSAKRMADWFELMGFTAGKGTGADNRYAGCVYLRGVGLGGQIKRDKVEVPEVRGLSINDTFDRTSTGQTVTFKGTDDEIPLEMHPLDWVLTNDGDVRAPWASWYRQEGSKLVKAYMNHFWEALKWELDDRGLCYPLRIHFDYEGWPRGPDQLNISDNTGRQTGCWPDVATDARWSTEDLLNYGGSAISDLIGSLTWDDTKRMYDPENNDFQQWWEGLSVVIRMQAVGEAVFADLATYFPETQWGNYYAFVADDPQFKYPDGPESDDQDVQQWFNTPVDDDDLEVPGDFSTPIFFSADNLLENLQGDYNERIGYSFAEVGRDMTRMRLDAVFGARSAKPVVPTFENPGRSVGPDKADPLYFITFEDISTLMAYAWQRGADEMVMFTFDPSLDSIKPAIAVCQWLRDWVHTIPQARQDRVGRVSRLGRRGM